MNNIKIGQIVISCYGHDMGNWYIVKQVLNDYLFLVDGGLKKLEKPKKKKAKHVLATKFIAEDLMIKLNAGQEIKDAEIRSAIKFFKEQ